MLKTIIASAFALGVAASAGAAEVRSNPTVLNQYLGNAPVSLSSEEKAALDLATKWQKGNNRASNVTVGPDGSIRFLYGAGQPTVVCAVLQLCDIELQPGETVSANGVHVGDGVRWLVEPSFATKDGLDTLHVVVKPTDADLETALVINTSRRSYHIRLKSHHADYMPRVGFVYPEETTAKWDMMRKAREKEITANTIPETGEYLGNLDFNYRLSGKAPWTPVRVFNDGKKTIIQMPEEMGQTEAPVLLVVRKEGGMFSDDETVLVNYRLSGDRYIVDAIFDRAVLVAGVGSDQDRVLIERRAVK